MRTRPGKTNKQRATAADTDAFRLVLIYEDLDTYEQVRNVFNALAQRLSPHRRLEQSAWKFDVLQMPKLFAIAVEDGTGADVIVLAMRGNDSLPDEINAWLDELLASRNDKPTALLSFYDRFQRQPESILISIYRRLHSVALRGGMDFYFQPLDVPEEDSDWIISKVQHALLKPATPRKRGANKKISPK